MAELSSGAYGASGGAMVQYAAGAVSLALLVGVGVWGAKLVMRDVSGVPVVQAQPGAMRVAPDNPGGIVAQDTGFAVNGLVESGGVAAPEERLQLAPETTVISTDDFAPPMVDETVPEATPAAAAPVTEARMELAEAPLPQQGTPRTAEEALAMADQIAAMASPLSTPAPAPAVESDLRVTEATAAALATAPSAVPANAAVRSTPRPVLRPVAAAAPVAAAPAPAAPAVQAASLPAGTRLVQLGAFESAEVAQGEWTRLMGRYGDYLQGKTPQITRAQSGGRTVYRLRAYGFSTGGDTGRLCSALEAKGQACMPVVIR